MRVSAIDGPLIAVVDDDRRILESLADLLESGGYRPCTFSSASDFLAAGVLASIGCLISDICMPGTNGWELEIAVNRVRPSLPTILITGHDETRSGLGVPHAGAGPTRMLFRKPINGDDLLAAIEVSLTADR